MEGFEESAGAASGSDLAFERLAGIARLLGGLKEAGADFGSALGNKAEAKSKAYDLGASAKKADRADFDLQFETPAIRTIKAAIPYIDRKYRRELGVMVKLIEIDKFLSDNKSLSTMSVGEKGGNMGMLRAVVPNLPKENRKMGEVLIRLLEIKEIAERKEL